MTEHSIVRTPSAYDFQLQIKSLLYTPIVANPQQEIVYRGQLRFSYRQFHQRVARLANALVRLGVKPGDTVAVMDWDSHRYLECFYAVPMIGAVLHTVNVRLSPEQILFTIDHAEDDLLLVHHDFLPLLDQIKGRIDTVKSYVLLTDDGGTPDASIPFAGEYEALLAAESDTFDFPDIDENSRATTFYTTGTTGLPKGVYFSHRQLVLHTLGVLAAMGTPASQGRFHQGDIYMPLTPMFHVHAWGFPYVATMAGVKQVYPGRYSPELILELIEKEGVTFSHCVPTILHMLLRSPAATDVDLSHWKVIIGGAGLSKALCSTALDYGIDLFTGYGMSETCPVLTLAHIRHADLHREQEVEIRCKTGAALPLVDLRLMDEQMGEVVRDGVTTGEIVVRAPWLTQGYLKDHKNSEQLWRGGWLHTGDVANLDASGYAKITDRIKDVIKAGGEWVSSLEFEDILTQHPAVAEAAVVGLPDTRWGERPLALVVPKVGAEPPTEKEIVVFVRDFADKGIISKHAVLLKVTLVNALPRTSVGKLDKKLMRQQHSPAAGG